jgi:hypothetical protein
VPRLSYTHHPQVAAICERGNNPLSRLIAVGLTHDARAGPEMAAEAIVVSRDGDSPAYDIDQLRQDLERFVFLLDGSEGEPLFGA